MLSIQFWWDSSEYHSYFSGVCVSCPCPEVELSKVEHEAIDCGLDEWREVGTMEKGMSLISRGLWGKTQETMVFGIRSVRVNGGGQGCSWSLEFEVEEEGAGCVGCVETGLV